MLITLTKLTQKNRPQSGKRESKSRGPLYYAFRRFCRNRLALSASIVFLLIILMAAFAPLITPTSPFSQSYLHKVRSFPDSENWFGVDESGRDYFTRIIYGARISLIIGFATAGSTLLLGIPIGTLGGYLGGATDWIVLRLMEIFSVIPPLLLGILLGTVTGGSVAMVILICLVCYWVRVCRLVRGQAKTLRSRDFVTAARALGGSTGHIITKHVIPNTVAQILVGLVLTIPRAMLLEAALSFLGVGINPPTPSWGKMINDGLYYIFYYWHLPLIPAAALGLTILVTMVVADGVRDALDPHLKGARR